MRAAGRLRVDVLGPIRVVDTEGRDLTPDGGLQRRLLALLVLRRGRVVSIDAAVDVLWGEQLPQDPSGALQTHVFRLRVLMAATITGLAHVALSSTHTGMTARASTV